MSRPNAFLRTAKIREIAGREASKILPDEDAETIPIPVKWENGTALLIMYYRALGPPDRRVVHPPHYAMYLEGSTGRVLRFAPASPQSLGITDPGRKVAGVGNTLAVDEFIKKRDRLFAISPQLWSAYAAGTPASATSLRPLVQEYWSAFAQITSEQEAPFYVQAAADFFKWLELARPGPRP